MQDIVLFFVLFKQKTAYEMRISDWSSDVCSSDLPAGLAAAAMAVQPPRRRGAAVDLAGGGRRGGGEHRRHPRGRRRRGLAALAAGARRPLLRVAAVPLRSDGLRLEVDASAPVAAGAVTRDESTPAAHGDCWREC